MDFEHYSAQQQHQQHPRQQQQWAPHLMHPGQSAFPSPVSPPTSLGDGAQYPPYGYHSIPQQHQHSPLDRSSTTLSLNLSSLSVASPTNLSPINPSPLHSHALPHPGHNHSHSHSAGTVSSTMSPVTPISPVNPSGNLQFGASSQQQQQQMHGGGHHGHQSNMQQTFQYSMPDHPSSGQGGIRYEDQGQHQFDMQGAGRRGLTTNTSTSSRSSSSSEVEKSVPRKRSFSANPPPNGIATPTSLSTSLEENVSITMYNELSPPPPFHQPPPALGRNRSRSHSHRRQQPPSIQMDNNNPPSYDDMDVGGYSLLDPSHSSQGNGSPIDGNASPIDGGSGNASGTGDGEGDDDDADGDDIEGERDDQLKPLEGVGGGLDMSSSGMGMLGKPVGTNNFVTKLYQSVYKIILINSIAANGFSMTG